MFLLCFCPLSREGSSGLHSTPSNSSFYGSQMSVPHHLLSIPLPQINTPTTLPTRFKSYLEATSQTPVPITLVVNSTISPYILLFTMADPTTSTPSGFVANTETLEDELKMKTVGLVYRSKFKRSRIVLLEQ